METFNKILLTLVFIMVGYTLVKYFYGVYKMYNLPKKKLKNINTDSNTNPLDMSNKTYYIILGVIVAIGVIIRIWKFGSVPGGFNQDGAMAAVDGKALADYGTDRFGTWLPAHLYAWGYGQMSSLLSYMIAFFVKIFGLNEITARLPQLIMSLAGGTFFYLFIRDIFGKGAGLIAAAFVAINPWHLVQSRWALDCNLLPHFFMGGLYFLNLGFTKRKMFTYISMIFFALCMYCYGITIYTIPVFLLAVCIYYMIKKRLTWKETLISAGIYLLISWPFLLTMALNFFKWETIELPFVTIQLFSGTTRAADILLFSDEPMKQLATNFKSMLNTTILQKKDLPWNDIKGFGTMFLCSIPFMITGVVELFRTKTNSAKALVLFALLSGVWAGLLTNNVNVNRINIVYYGIMMFIVLGVYFVIKEFKYAKWTNLVIYAVLGVMLISTYFGEYADSIKNYFYEGFGEAIAEVKDSGAETIYVTADAQGKGYRQVSEILTQFYDKTDAEYFQGKTNINNGEELLPYKQRFTFVSMSESVVRQGNSNNAAYVIMTTDLPLFDTENYTIKQYGRFCSVVEK